MANGTQHCHLSGRVVKDFEWKKTNSSHKVGSFSLATTNCQYNKEAKREGSTFLEITCFGYIADFADKHLRKGEAVDIDFHIANNNYKTKEGNTVYGFSFIADDIKFTLARAKYLNGEIPEDATDETMKNFKADKDAEFLNVDDGSDDELPFN